MCQGCSVTWMKCAAHTRCLRLFCTLAWRLWKGDVSLTHKLTTLSNSSSPHPLSPWVGWLDFVYMCERFLSSPLAQGAVAVMTTAQMNVWTVLLLFILQALCQLWNSPILRWLVREREPVIQLLTRHSCGSIFQLTLSAVISSLAVRRINSSSLQTS